MKRRGPGVHPSLRHDRPRRGPLYVGLTGSIASGKTTVLKLFAKMGFHVISSDSIVATVYRRWGLSKSKLRAEIGNSDKKLKALERKVHPQVEREVLRILRKTRRPTIVEVPLLFEAKFNRHFDFNIFVFAPRQVRKERALETRKMPAKLFHFLDAKQWPTFRKAKKSDFILHNSADRKSLERQVKGLVALLHSSSRLIK